MLKKQNEPEAGTIQVFAPLISPRRSHEKGAFLWRSLLLFIAFLNRRRKNRVETYFPRNYTEAGNFSSSQKYVPIDLANLSTVIASKAKQSHRFWKRLLRRSAPRNDRLSERSFGNRFNYDEAEVKFLKWVR